MSKVVILAKKFAKPDGSLEIGGIETYISYMIEALRDQYELAVYQPARKNFNISLQGAKVVGIEGFSVQQLADFVTENCLTKGDVLVFSTEQLGARSAWRSSVVIQHGIYWDLPVAQYTKNRISRMMPNLYKIFDMRRNLKRIMVHRHVVCVDHAYLSWLRTIMGKQARGIQFSVVPNCADDRFFSLGSLSDDRDEVTFLFARRLMEFRGTRVFARAAQKLTGRYSNVRVIVSGDGPDLQAMHRMLPENKNVKYLTVDHKDMPQVISKADVVVVPSLGSEGTSLSAIEGMAAGRAVVASAVGGLTNIIIDKYNGILVQPGDEFALYAAMEDLVLDENLRRRLGARASETAFSQLNFDVWAKRWRRIIDNIRVTA